ncbi:hypothetical protein P0136_13095 [Lentisphaerota bacterium ZTH]|nr:hypothetical protein JYG24_09390 [Lentisphaerota bacterium]WET06294.1 hypothetical protein P0136_13095 [Lentisphaerota bacterium ZTH]
MITGKEMACFEAALNSENLRERSNVSAEIQELCRGEKIVPAESIEAYNLHCHTFCSYNGYGFSPSYIAWLAAKKGWFAAGIVDSDVLDGADEFFAAASSFDVRAVCGIESRVFVDAMAGKIINCSGEPGIAYHMGVGFTGSNVPAEQMTFLRKLKKKAVERTVGIVERVNIFLSPVELNIEKDLLNLTPYGNVTERHACAAYRKKAEQIITDEAERTAFWAQKLNVPLEEATPLVSDPVKLETAICLKTMTRDGAGYVQPATESLPALEEMNAFVIACGAVPTVAWLDGSSDGEADPEKLLDMHIDRGAAMLNIIPDRNWNFADQQLKAKKVACLNAVMAAAAERDIPVIVGTEMKISGQKLVDDFESTALAPHAAEFIRGAAIAYAHTKLTSTGMGYLSEWSAANFSSKAEKNVFFENFGRKLKPNSFAALKAQIVDMTAAEIIDSL